MLCHYFVKYLKLLPISCKSTFSLCWEMVSYLSSETVFLRTVINWYHKMVTRSMCIQPLTGLPRNMRHYVQLDSGLQFSSISASFNIFFFQFRKQWFVKGLYTHPKPVLWLWAIFFPPIAASLSNQMQVDMWCVWRYILLNG